MKRKVKAIAGILGATTARKVVSAIVVAALGLAGLNTVDPELVAGLISLAVAIVQVAVS